jgi:hypothetical protein
VDGGREAVERDGHIQESGQRAIGTITREDVFEAVLLIHPHRWRARVVAVARMSVAERPRTIVQWERLLDAMNKVLADD